MNIQSHTSVTRDRYSEGISRQALRFFFVSAISIIAAGLLAWGLMRLFGKSSGNTVLFPPGFAVSTLLLGYGSFSMTQALHYVRIERQGDFRKWLLISLLVGIVFMGVQSYSLWAMFPAERSHESASLGVAAFIVCLAGLHGLHFLVAVLFVVFVLSRAINDRYDHEYYWGVKVCTWFWHFLLVVWFAVLAVIAIAL